MSTDVVSDTERRYRSIYQATEVFWENNMDIIHIANANGRGGYLPLCGFASWEALTLTDELNECWECASIAGTETADDVHQLIIGQWCAGNISQREAEVQAANVAADRSRIAASLSLPL